MTYLLSLVNPWLDNICKIQMNYNTRSLKILLTKALFKCENFLDFATVALSFICPIIIQL